MGKTDRCAVCSKRFKQKKNGKKQYVCSNCGNERLYFVLAKGFKLVKKEGDDGNKS